MHTQLLGFREGTRHGRFGRVALAVTLLSLAGAIAAEAAAPPVEFVDDAGRHVTLPAAVSRVFPAGAPADALLYTLAPQMLAGRNQRFTDAALEYVSPLHRTFPAITTMPNPEDGDADTELLALKPDVYLDYGDTSADYVSALENVQRRTGVPGILLDGRLDAVPEVYRRLGRALGVPERGERLAAAADAMLDRHRNALRTGRTPPRVYIACSGDGLVPCREGESAAEQIRFLGAVNAAGATGTAMPNRVALDEIVDMDPDAVIVLNRQALERIRTDAAWQQVRAVRNGRVLLAPSLPFNWGPRPPSVNRLPGLVWLRYAVSGQPFDEDFFEEIRGFFALFYQVDLDDRQLLRLVE